MTCISYRYVAVLLTFNPYYGDKMPILTTTVYCLNFHHQGDESSPARPTSAAKVAEDRQIL